MKDKFDYFDKDIPGSAHEDFVNKGAERINKDDLTKVIERLNDIKSKIFNNKSFRAIRNDAEVLFSILKDYSSGQYSGIAWYAVAALVFALLYVLSPIDAIPDYIPVIGYMDDAAVLTACIKLIGAEIEAYEKWKLKES